MSNRARRVPPRRWIAKEIARLDPVNDSTLVLRLILSQLVPRFGGAMLLNLFYSVGFMRVSGQLEGARAIDRRGTGKAHRAGDLRATDTIAYFAGWFQHGPLSEHGSASIARVKAMHDHYAREYSMSNETFLHTIAFFTVQFERLFRLIDAQGFSETEKVAQLTHWRLVGEQLGTRELPETWDEMERFLDWYEASPAWFGPTPEGRRCADALIDQFSNRWLPTGLRWAGRPLLLSLHEDHVLHAIGHQKPARPVAGLIRRLVRAGLFLNRRVVPDRRKLLDLTALAPNRPSKRTTRNSGSVRPR